MTARTGRRPTRAMLVDRLAPGTVLTCLDNTLQPARRGAVQTVTGPVRDGRVLCRTTGGVDALLHIPCGNRGITWLDDDTVTLSLAYAGRLADHTATWRIEKAAG